MLGLLLAPFFGAVGVVIARMALVFFGLVSWEAWFFLFMAGASIGAGIGGLIAWLWFRNTSRTFTAIMFLLAILAGAIGGVEWLQLWCGHRGGLLRWTRRGSSRTHGSWGHYWGKSDGVVRRNIGSSDPTGQAECGELKELQRTGP